MERLTLSPSATEIMINSDSVEGAIDLFSYGPDADPSARALGSLYVIGRRQDDSNNMGYMASLLGALARREYYAQPGQPAREAFSRTLHKMNEVVDEFFKSSGAELSIGVFAIAGSTLLVSKLDKFKMLLARKDEVIDILNNVALFSKEHLARKQFSSIISGTVQPGDRILAYYPAKAVVSRERYLKSHLLKLDASEFQDKVEAIGRQHTSFATAMFHVHMVQTAHAPTVASVQPIELTPAVDPTPAPVERAATVAWAPRQHYHGAPTQESMTADEPHTEMETEVPQLISSEFSLGTRQNAFSKATHRIRLIRLNGRGKAMFLVLAVLLIAGAAIGARALWFTSPQEEKGKEALQAIRDDLALAQSKRADDPGQARQILVRALNTLAGSANATDPNAKLLNADLLHAMDGLDNAQDAQLSLYAAVDIATDRLVLTTWSSASQSAWAVSKAPDGGMAVVNVKTDGISGRVVITDINPTLLLPFTSGVIVLDGPAHKIVRVVNGTAKTFTLPTQETVRSAYSYEGNLYVLTEASILKVTDLDTDKPVTKAWLIAATDLAPNASKIIVIDGEIHTLGTDGMLATYYKGKRTALTQSPLTPSGAWELLAGPQADQLAVATTDTRRIYIIGLTTGALARTLKLASDQPFVAMSPGPDGALFVISKDNKIWRVQ